MTQLRTFSSVVAADDLGQFVAARWPSVGPRRCLLLHVGQNDTYLLGSESGERLAVRVYRAGWRSDDDVRFETELLCHLSERGVAVAAPLRDADGQLFMTVDAPEGRRQVAVFTWAAGNAPSLEGFPAARYGALMGRIHREADSFQGERRRFVLDRAHLVDLPVSHVLPLLNTEDAAFVTQAAAAAVEVLVRLPVSEERGVCHGDLIGNVHHDGDTLTAFDFDCAGMGWRAYDLATALLQFQAWAANPAQLWQQFIVGYRTERDLHDDTVGVAELFVPIRYLWLLGLHAGIADQLGHNRDPEWLHHRLLGGLRQWTTAHPHAL